METYLSIEGLAKYLGVAEKTIRKWVLNEDIPFHKIMKVIRFRLSEIERWIETSGKFPKGLLSAVGEGGAGDGLLSAVDEAAGSEADSSGGAARGAGSGGEAGAALLDGAACGLFPDDKKNGSAVEASAVPAVAGDVDSTVGGKE